MQELTMAPKIEAWLNQKEWPYTLEAFKSRSVFEASIASGSLAFMPTLLHSPLQKNSMRNFLSSLLPRTMDIRTLDLN